MVTTRSGRDRGRGLHLPPYGGSEKGYVPVGASAVVMRLPTNIVSPAEKNSKLIEAGVEKRKGFC